VKCRGYGPPKGRAGFGLAELDKLLEGGLPRDSATLIVGSTGIGKTLLALHFASGGPGEKGLFLSFYEPARSLVERAKRIGLDLEGKVAAGELVIDYAPPIELDGDRLITGILKQIDSIGARRLVIDGVAELERAIGEDERVRDFLVALLLETRRRSVSILFTKEIAKIAGAELDFSETPTSLIAENLIFLRHVEMNGRLHRILSILKMRASNYETNLREFEITAKGFAVLEPLRTATGLLTGLPRPVSAGAT
jgi:circadian clock protein KaiC